MNGQQEDLFKRFNRESLQGQEEVIRLLGQLVTEQQKTNKMLEKLAESPSKTAVDTQNTHSDILKAGKKR